MPGRRRDLGRYTRVLQTVDFEARLIRESDSEMTHLLASG